MSKIGFLIALLATIQITNIKNGSKGTEDNLVFTKADSLWIIAAFIVAFVVDKFSYHPKYLLFVGGFTVLCFMLFVILNAHREKTIKDRHEQILKIFDACTDIFGKKNPEEIEFDNVPFKMETEDKTGEINQIVFDMSADGRFDDAHLTYCQYNLNKFFPSFQWTYIGDAPKREVTFKGLPKPPSVAMFPGSDYRPTGWIPLGLSGAGEVGWNLSGPKDLGQSSYIMEDGKPAGSVKLPSAPQALAVGSTGGGKSIWLEQVVDVLN